MTTPPDLTPLDRDLPLLLLPARLEARYGRRDATAVDGSVVGVPVLHVRVYPDDVTVSRHEPSLTAVEDADGRAFWGEHARVVDGEDAAAADARRRTAWARLAADVGPHRARHVAAATRDGQAPSVRTGPAGPPVARLLPDRWVVSGWLDGERVVQAVGEPVAADLPLGPAPGPDGTPLDPDDPMLVTGPARWLVDLDAARAVGMAVTVDLATVEQVATGALPAVVTRGLDRLYAIGVRLPHGELTAEGEAQALAALLEDHAVSDGAAFLEPGTPTNSLPGRPSGWTSSPDPGRGYDAVLAPPVLDDAPSGALRGHGRDGTAAAAALGIAPATAARLDGATVRSQHHARLMAETLFPVTWGELVSQLLVPSTVDDTTDRPLVRALQSAYAFVREHWNDAVRGRGPLPTLRIGRQPYGLLPVTDPQRWARQPDEPPELAGMAGVLHRLRPFWRIAADQVAPLAAGRGALDADEAAQRLARAMALGPVPHEGAYYARTVTGELASVVYSSTHHLAGLEVGGVPLVGGVEGTAVSQAAIDLVVAETNRTVLRAMLATVPGFATRSRLARMTLGEAQLLRVPVARTEPTRTGAPGPADYLASLGRASWRAMQQSTPWGDDDAPLDLLFQVVRRSLLLANEQACFSLASGWREAGHAQLFTELVAAPPELRALDVEAGLVVRDALSAPLEALSQMAFVEDGDVPALGARLASHSIADLVAVRDDLAEAVAQLPIDAIVAEPLSRLFLDTQDAVAGLGAAALPDAEYARLLGEGLATCANRLDAWATSLATRRLQGQRDRRPTGVQVGGFGWLLDLRPETRRIDTTLEPERVPEGWADEGLPDAPLHEPAQPVGWVHAPSLAQARTGGILRSGELAHGTGGSTAARLDLTSARVRTAAWVLDAVQQGQPLDALLGYRLERGMHERSSADGTVNLHRWVDELRTHYPRRGVTPAPQDGPPSAQVAPAEVVDGLAVWEAWRAGRPLLPDPVGAGMTGEERARLELVLADLDGTVEAVADVLVAEGVHQLGAGEHARAGATLSAVAAGQAPPEAIDVIRSPRSGGTLDHRVLLALDSTAADVPAGWDPTRPRAQVTPALDAWLARLLGAPERWRAEVVTPAHGDVPEAVVPCSLADAGPLCALDVVCESARVGGVSPLAQRLVARAGATLPPGTLPSAARPAALVRSPAAVGVGDGTWDELDALAGTLRDVLAAARPALPADVAAPPRVVDARSTPHVAPVGVDPEAISTVASALDGVVEPFRGAAKRLAEAVEPDVADAAAAREQLTILARYGVVGATLPAGATADDVLGAGSAVAAATATTVGAVDARLAGIASLPPTDPARVDGLQRAARQLLGDPVVLAPALGARPDLIEALAAPPPVDPARLEEWLLSTARVRPVLSGVADLRATAEALGLPGTTLTAAQPGPALPYWWGGEWPERDGRNELRGWQPPDGPATHLLLLTEDGAPVAGADVGIVLDALAEALPAATATTGLAVHVDAPDARPPQALLLAVHPDPANAGVPWSWPLVESILDEALELARLRTVELDELAVTAIDEYLPATYVREGLENAPSFLELIAEMIQRHGAWGSVTVAANKGGVA